jgi:hypothetical protein
VQDKIIFSLMEQVNTRDHSFLFPTWFVTIHPIYLLEILFVETIPDKKRANYKVTYPCIFQMAFSCLPIVTIVADRQMFRWVY